MNSILRGTAITLALIGSVGLAAATQLNPAYNSDRIGWNRGGQLTTDTTGKDPMCFKQGKEYDGPQLVGKSDAATHRFQNFWGRCGTAVSGH
jgi:hypothetical protein